MNAAPRTAPAPHQALISNKVMIAMTNGDIASLSAV